MSITEQLDRLAFRFSLQSELIELKTKAVKLEEPLRELGISVDEMLELITDVATEAAFEPPEAAGRA